MEKSIKNKKISSLIKREMAKIFLLETNEKGRLISISQVIMTTNLVIAKLYISIFPINDKNKILINLKKKSGFYRKILGKHLRYKLKTIPIINFYFDEKIEYNWYINYL